MEEQAVSPKFKVLPGLSFGRGNHSIKLDLFFDLQCPYSKNSWDVIGQSVLHDWCNQLDVYFHAICLTHHRQSWDLARTLFAVKSFDSSKASDFLNLVYGDHEQFYNANWKDKGQDTLLRALAGLSGELIGISSKDVLERIESDAVYSDAKKSIHYAAIKQIWSTPTFVINDVTTLELDSSSTLQDWKNMISELTD